MSSSVFFYWLSSFSTKDARSSPPPPPLAPSSSAFRLGDPHLPPQWITLKTTSIRPTIKLASTKKASFCFPTPPPTPPHHRTVPPTPALSLERRRSLQQRRRHSRTYHPDPPRPPPLSSPPLTPTSPSHPLALHHLHFNTVNLGLRVVLITNPRHPRSKERRIQASRPHFEAHPYWRDLSL